MKSKQTSTKKVQFFHGKKDVTTLNINTYQQFKPVYEQDIVNYTSIVLKKGNRWLYIIQLKTYNLVGTYTYI